MVQKNSRDRSNGRLFLLFTVLTGTALNLLLSLICSTLKLPLWLDTVGTILAAGMGGVFSGILTGACTSVLCMFFNPNAIYYTLVGVLIAMVTTLFVKNSRIRKRSHALLLTLILALISGVLGTVIQWILLGGAQFPSVAETSRLMSEASGISYFLCVMIVNTGLNVVDKGVSVGGAWLIAHFMPEEIKEGIRQSGWRQQPLSSEDIKRLGKGSSNSRSMQHRMGVMLGVATTSVAVLLSVISINIFYTDRKDEYRSNAEHAAELAAELIDPDMVADYLKKGRAAEGYEETEKLLYKVRENAPGVEYLYVLKIRQDGCYVVFDLDTPEVPAYQPGEIMEFEEAFDDYLPSLFAGEDIPDIESNDVSGWVLTTYRPVKDEVGRTVCYVGADVSLGFLSRYTSEFLAKILLIFSGFFILILAFGIWTTNYSLVYPIGAMTKASNEFVKEVRDQKALDEKVRAMSTLDIQTDDEVEELYSSIDHMARGMAEQMKEIRYYAEATSQMQSGLIITMADMVENRDSDTGAHVQKTAAYVRIIAEALRKKGYYPEKLTDKYISDIVMSAPLHDVGKINIPDAILNKPGKLNDDEYAIMKTHTTAGKKIVEKAISTVQGENYLKEARNMAAYHHERWDGKGYPEGLKGEVIPLSARIMSVADVFDALASPRIYKPAFPIEKALEIISDGAGTQFDPKCVEVFMESMDQVIPVLKKYQEE